MILNHEPFIVSKQGAAIMSYNLEWEDEEAPARGLRNPWAPGVNPTALVSDGDGHYHKPQFPEGYVATWKKERDNYIKERKVFIAERLLEDFGYDYFVSYCQQELDLAWLIDSKRGCEANDKQCNLYCTFYDKGCKF